MQDDVTMAEVSMNMDAKRPMLWNGVPKHHLELMKMVAYDVSNGKLPQRYRGHASTHLRWHPDETPEEMWAWYQGFKDRVGYANIYGYKQRG